MANVEDDHVHIFVVGVVKTSDTVGFRDVYFEFHDNVRLRFKLVSGIGKCGPKTVASVKVVLAAWCLLLLVTARRLLVGSSSSCMRTILHVTVHILRLHTLLLVSPTSTFLQWGTLPSP